MALLLFLKKFFRKQAEGFSLIGIMVASSVGLIVIAGITQLFINMSSQIKVMENRGDLRGLKTLLTRRLQDKKACQKTLDTAAIRRFLYSGGTGSLDFTVVKDSDGNTIIDLASASSVEASYGLAGHISFRLQCGASSCKDCNTASNWETVPGTTDRFCKNQWNISLISQSVLKGVHRFNKPQDLIIVQVNFTDTSNPDTFNCGGTSLAPLLASIGGHCLTLKGGVSDGRTLIGCGSAQNHAGKGMTVFGYQNTSAKSTGAYNSFFGYRTGESNTTGENNTFIGLYAGRANRTGKNNTFIGSFSGMSNIAGKNNTFIGYNAGAQSNGDNNTYIGYSAFAVKSGKNNTVIGYDVAGHGDNNTVIGYGAQGYGNNNVVIGYKAVAGFGGANNTVIGYKAGGTSGSNNIYIQAAAGAKTESNMFRVGGWIEGEIGTDTFKVKGKRVSYEGHTHSLPPSSKTVKKNIKPFKNFQKALQDILKTPLFTFQLKKDPLKKNRMGVISEELPPHLQIKETDKPSHPDWTSIYGTFWGAIKALHKLFMEFKGAHQDRHKSLSQENRKLFMELKGKNNKLKKEIERLEGQITDIKKEIRQKCGV